MLKTFTERVYDVVQEIPKGSVLTYAQVAQRAGSVKAVRAVGNILNKNYNPDIPCHRVVRSDGSLGGYNRGSVEKKKRLYEEGYVK
jgi:O-6-methylguanine DNA methyltransferase